MIHREIFDETLEECERLLFAAEQEVQKTRRAAEAAARRRVSELVNATSASLDELSATAEAERHEARRERLQAETYRLGAERIQSALSKQATEIEVERKAAEARRAQLDTALAAAEALRDEAQAIHENAQGVAAALLEAAAVRAELLESTLDARIAEVATTLATLQDLVLDRSQGRRVEDDVDVREFLSSTFREIREYREAELSAAGQQADDLIERAQLTASEIVADTRREQERLLEGADPRSVLDVVAVLLAESRPTMATRSGEPREADATESTTGTADPALLEQPLEAERLETGPIEPATVAADPAPVRSQPTSADVSAPETEPAPDIDIATPPDPTPALPDLPPPPSTVPDHDDEAAAAIAAALEDVEDPTRITDRELADVLSTTDRLMGEHATIDGALDLARSLADALGPVDAAAAPRQRERSDGGDGRRDDASGSGPRRPGDRHLHRLGVEPRSDHLTRRRRVVRRSRRARRRSHPFVLAEPLLGLIARRCRSAGRPASVLRGGKICPTGLV